MARSQAKRRRTRGAVDALPSGALRVRVYAGEEPLTFDAVISGSELIVDGTVEEVMFGGLAFRLAVKEVFKGPAVGREVRIGPTVEPQGRGCEVGLETGQHVVLGIVDIDAPLNSLATAVWFVSPDGSVSSPGSPWELATNVEDLRDELRRAVPDTAMPFANRDAPVDVLATLLGLACVAAAIGVVGRRAVHGSANA